MSAIHVGPRGTAHRLEFEPGLAGAETTVAGWLLTGGWHPFWPQSVLVVVHLRESDGAPAPHLAFPGATHELLVAALNPGEPGAALHTPETLNAGGLAAVGGWLLPIDVVHQFEATDAEMTELADLCAKACVDGALTPEVGDAPTRYREMWLTACVRTLAHMRGEEHAP